MEKLGKFVAKLLDSLNARSYGEKILYDLQESWYYILIGIFAGAFISFIWIIMMRFVAAVMVWASIILSILLLGRYAKKKLITANARTFMKFLISYLMNGKIPQETEQKDSKIKIQNVILNLPILDISSFTK